MSDYIGSVGAKVSVKVKLVNSYEYLDTSFSYYGTTKYIYTMKDEAGNVLVWKTTSTLQMGDPNDSDTWEFIHVGDTLRIEGKVKSHEEYKGTKQTVLTRCKYELVERGVTKEEIEAQKREAQLATLVGHDFVWKKMPYKQYKEHYSDCETVINSFDYEDGVAVVDVIIREGRLKNSGTRGMHYSGYQFMSDDGKLVVYRAVSPETARKRLVKEHPNSEDWELVKVFHYNTHRWY